ncbi:MAG: hypothetical protein LAP87_06620 [Acidobacteriia bacterium]|nr:hypothetical protein [Terriglobia bacterium]
MAAALAVGHKITIGGAVYSSREHSRLTALRIHSALDVPVNSARIAMAPPDGLDASPDDSVAIELGYDDQLDLVFSGQVRRVDYRIGSLTMEAGGSFHKLLAARFNLLYEKSKAGDIVSGLAGLVGVPTGGIEDGPEYPFVALSDGESAYQGLRRLAERGGFDLYADVEDKLVFAPYNAAETHPLQYGVNVLEARVEAVNPLVTAAVVCGESPASLGQGDDAASWLAKKDILGKAGDSSGLLARRFEPAARTEDMAAQMAEAVLAGLTEKRVCSLKVLGTPPVQLGHAVELSRMPQESQNGVFKVIGVEHRLDGRHGFISIIRGREQ